MINFKLTLLTFALLYAIPLWGNDSDACWDLEVFTN